MSKHGGRIEFETVVGKGTTFRIYLPAAAKEDQAIIKKADTIARRRILVVENDPQTSATMRELLQKLDQEVEAAADGNDALLKFRTEEYNLF